MNFASDNWSGVAPEISQSLLSNSTGFAAAYGDSELEVKVKAKFCEVFEKEVAVFFVNSGTIANCLSIASFAKPGGITLCHSEAHIVVDECGGPELFSSGGRLLPVEGDFGRIEPSKLESALNRFGPHSVHYGQPTAISITQASEVGTVYSLDEIQTISKIAKTNNLPLHMDGSRLANGLAYLGVSPAQVTWQSGVDILSFGGTKNGCWCAEAIILFDLELAEQMTYAHKRAGQLMSKSRFIAAQYDAYLNNDLWLEMAGHANDMADKLREGVANSASIRLGWPSQSNEVFCVLPLSKAKTLTENGVKFHDWNPPGYMDHQPGKNEALYRFVTSFDTTRAEIEKLIGWLA